MIALIVGGFFKVGIFFYAAVIGTADLFQLKEYQRLVYPLGISVLFLSIAIASNFAEHIKEGLRIVTIYMHVPLQIFIPTILLLIAMVKHSKNKKRKKGE